MLASLLAALVSCAPESAPTPWPPVDEAYIEASAATYGFRLGAPANVAIAPDGEVLFTRTPPRSFVADLYRRDPATGEIRTLLTAETLLEGRVEELTPEEKARRERMRKATRGISGFQLSEDGALLLVPLSDRLFAVERATGAHRELETGPATPYDPQLSPDGSRVAWVVDGDVYVGSTDGKDEPLRLTERPSPEIEYGVAEFVAQEEMGRLRGFWWSPDGSRLAVQRSDRTKVDTVWVSDPAHPEQSPTPFRYPRPGRPNVKVRLEVRPSKGGTAVEVGWDHEHWPYLCRVIWEENAPLTLVVMNRAQTELAVLAADERFATTVLLTEQDQSWLDLDAYELPSWLPDGSGFLWTTERAGAWQLELRGRDGALERELTPVSLGMQKFAGHDREGGLAWVVASADPTESQVFSVPVAGGTPRRVSVGRGVHDVSAVARKGGWVGLSSSLDDGSARSTLVDRDGKILAELPSVAEAPPWTPSVEWTTVEVEGREHHAALVRPRAFEAGRRYPVLVHVYAGPTSRMVSAATRSYRLDQWFADAGFVVVAIDGRGTPNRGRDWERAVQGDLITTALADQVAVLQALGGRFPELDLERTGIFGWSFGGYASALAVELRPDVFRAAVAGAPVTDWALYDTFYTERYMRTPEENPEGYERSSAVAHAGELTRPLLVIHGTSDDNVHFAHSLALSEAAFRAGRGSNLTLLPVSATHMTPDPVVALALAKAELEFFRANLD